MPQECPHAKHGHAGGSHPPEAHHGPWRRRFLRNSLVGGVFALLWLLLRSGSKPSRLTYPCQQAAFSAASLAFGVPVVAALVAVRHRLAALLRRPGGITLGAVAVFFAAGLWGYLSYSTADEPPLREPPRDYRARVYHVTHCPQDAVGEHFIGLDHLIALMGQDGLKLYRSATVAPLSGPDGIIAADDTVIIKLNYQWPERGGTNTDLLRGLIRRLVDHPDGFAGQVVVCENSQFNSIDGFDRATNNAQDHTLSPHDVVVGFQGQGYAEDIHRRMARRRDDVRDLRLAPRECTGLVEDNRCQPVCVLQALASFDQDAGFRAEARPHHDRRRGRQAQGAGAGNDEHGNKIEEGSAEDRIGNKIIPDQKGDQTNPDQ